MAISHHFTDDILLDYASGGLAESWSLAVATHLALCPLCRARVSAFEALGGATLDEVEPVALGTGARTALELATSQPAVDEAPSTPAMKPCVFPEPLRSAVGADIDDVAWWSIGGGIRQKILATGDAGVARLLFIPPGVATPAHSHQGMEYTLVLSGGFYDGPDAFQRGDVEVTDRTSPHQPRAMDDAPCVTLAVTDAPLQFVNLLPRLFQPFLRI